MAMRARWHARWALLALLFAACAHGAPSLDDPASLIDPDEANIDEDENADAAWPGGLDAFEGRGYTVFDGVGFIQEVVSDGPIALIDGLVYGFTPDAEVRLRSGYGAPTLLTPGMAVEYYFTDATREGRAGEIIAVIEIAREDLAD